MGTEAADAKAAGFVELAPNPSHRRSSLVRLTLAGCTAIAAVTTREQELMGRVGGDLTGTEVEATLRVLHHMLAGLAEMERERHGHG